MKTQTPEYSGKIWKIVLLLHFECHNDGNNDDDDNSDGGIVQPGENRFTLTYPYQYGEKEIFSWCGNS